MQSLISEISKYIIIIIAAIYAYLGFSALIKSGGHKKEVNKEIYVFQAILIILFHFTGFLCIYLKVPEIKVILLYLSQLSVFVISSVIYRAFYKEFSKVLFFHMHFLIMTGFVFVTRLDFKSGVKQTVFVAAALAACLLLPFLIEKMEFLRNMGWLYAVGGIGILAYVFIRARAVYGAKNWIAVFGVRFQPSEFVKIALIFMIASFLYVSKSLKQIAIITCSSAVMVLLLVLSRDLGGALLYFVTFAVMMYFATGKKILLIIYSGGGVLAAVAGYFLFSHVRVRVLAFLDPWSNIDDAGYQVAQSLFGIGSGGWFGFGLYNGSPKSTPVVESDFIFSGISEELGLLFTFCIILIYICTFFAIIFLAWKVKNEFHQLLSIGCLTMYSFQVFLSIGGTVKFIPSTGVTLPLISTGGSSVISTIMLFFIIQGLYVAGDGRDGVKNRKVLKKPVGLTYGLAGMFALVLCYLTYFEFFTSPKIINNSYNKRLDLYAAYVSRGEIISSDGVKLAYTKEDKKGNSIRVYPYKELYSHIVGRNSSGKTGIEALMNYELLSSNENILDRVAERLTGIKNKGDTVVSTIDSRLQTALDRAIGNNKGAGIIIEPETGKILAMASKPGYDPNTVTENWEKLSDLSEDEAKLVNRATNGLYPPGSTFKLVTALQYIKKNKDYDKFLFNCSGVFVSEKEEISCFNKIKHGRVDLAAAFAKSCNGAFAEIGLGLNKDDFAKLCKKLLFNKTVDFDIPTSKSSFVLDSSSEKGEVMLTAIGQGKTQITPLHNALLVAAVANNGMLMKPYTVDRVTTFNGKSVIKEYTSEKYKKLFSKKQAEILKGFMRKTVTEGTARKLSWLSFPVYAKTGTAEYKKADGKIDAHSWIIGFGEKSGKKIAVSIIIEGGSRGSYTATDAAHTVFSAWK